MDCIVHGVAKSNFHFHFEHSLALLFIGIGMKTDPLTWLPVIMSININYTGNDGEVFILEQQFSARGSFDPHGTFGSVWRYFLFLQLGQGSCYWHLVG